MSAFNPIPVAVLALVLALYYLIPRRGLQTGLLLAASGAFYLYFFGRGIWLLLILAAAFYAGALGASRGHPGRRRRAFALALAGSLALFLLLRYGHALTGFLPRSASWAKTVRSGVILPVGLSFFLFKGLSYLIDVRRGRSAAAGNPFPLLLYLFYFPQVTAGPIQRWDSFQENVRPERRWDAAALYQGAKLLLLGMFKKMVVADRLAFYVNQVFAAPEGKGLHVALAACLYSIQIYADFSGYSDMANGAARLFGHAAVPNFSFPYFSRSIPEFWRRWHVTLSAWLRDYLFLPLSFAVSRRLKKERLLGLKAEHWIYSSATLLTMAAAGFWHGARWTFVIWGLLFGAYMSLGQLTRRARSRLRRKVFGNHRLTREGASMLASFALVTFAWVFFRSPSLAAAWKFIAAAGVGFPAFGLGHLYLNLLLALALALVDLAQKSRPRFIAAFPPWGKAAALALALCLVILLGVDTGNEFIYLRF